MRHSDPKWAALFTTAIASSIVGENGLGSKGSGLFIAGIITSAAGDGGLALFGPAVWIAGIGGKPESIRPAGGACASR